MAIHKRQIANGSLKVQITNPNLEEVVVPKLGVILWTLQHGSDLASLSPAVV